MDTRDTLATALCVWAAFAQRQQIPGVQRVQRLCCGTCLDFRIVVSVEAEAYKAWRDLDHEPEAEILDVLRVYAGISDLRAQLLLIMDA